MFAPLLLSVRTTRFCALIIPNSPFWSMVPAACSVAVSVVAIPNSSPAKPPPGALLIVKPVLSKNVIAPGASGRADLEGRSSVLRVTEPGMALAGLSRIIGAPGSFCVRASNEPALILPVEAR